jgi:NAD-dependent DNA ligase
VKPEEAKKWIEVIKESLAIISSSSKPEQPRKLKVPKKLKAPKKLKVPKKLKINGKTVVVTGTISMHRRQFKEHIERNGAFFGSTVSSNTDMLIVGMKPGKVKINTATDKGVPVLSWDQFRKTYMLL